MSGLTSKAQAQYEVVIGLEVHVQLSTKSKAFCSDDASFGGAPNTHVSMVSLGHPGTLPFINKKMVAYAVKMGLACKSEINTTNTFARKNYFYADLPKGYQITQDQQPICIGGYVPVRIKNEVKNIALHHIHMEDDAGKSIHNQDSQYSSIDLNRAGVPLLEIVSEPDMRSSEEAVLFLQEIQKIVRYLDISDGNMEEGSLRCDANISIRKKGYTVYGNRCEVKNLNSTRNLQRAIEHEFERQVNVVEKGGKIEQTTLNFNAETGETSVLRTKEMANDYRYFPEPDLLPLKLTKTYIDNLKATMPALPSDLYQKYIRELKLSDYDAGVLTADKDLALFFEEVVKRTKNYKSAANWVMGTVTSYLNENSTCIAGLNFPPSRIAELITLVDDGKINNSVASGKLFTAVISEPDKDVMQLASELNLMIDIGHDELDEFIRLAITQFPDKVKEYQKGKKGVLGLFMGDIMKRSKGKIDPKKTNQLLIKALEEA